MKHLAFTGLILLGLGSATGPARADSIDGNWCNAAGTRQMQIAGTSIVTPGGRKIEGRYARHSFTYAAPGPKIASNSALVISD